MYSDCAMFIIVCQCCDDEVKNKINYVMSNFLIFIKIFSLPLSSMSFLLLCRDIYIHRGALFEGIYSIFLWDRRNITLNIQIKKFPSKMNS